jgi:hypothetical protein
LNSKTTIKAIVAPGTIKKYIAATAKGTTKPWSGLSPTKIWSAENETVEYRHHHETAHRQSKIDKQNRTSQFFISSPALHDTTTGEAGAGRMPTIPLLLLAPAYRTTVPTNRGTKNPSL